MYDESIEDIRAYWEDDGNSYLVGDYLLGLSALVLFLPFLVCLQALLGRAEGGPQIWSKVGFYGGLLMIAVAMTATASWTALAFAAEDLDDTTLTTLMYLDIGAWNAFPYAIGVFLFFSSVVMAMTGALWKWLGYLGLILGIAAFLTPLGILDQDSEDIFDTIGFLSFIGLMVWLLAASIGMIMKKDEPLAVVVVEPVVAAT